MLLFLFSGAVIPVDAKDALGWTLIGIVVSLCIYNTIVIGIISCRYFKLLILRTHAKVAILNKKRASRKVLPIIPPLTLEKLGLTGKANQVKNMHMLDPKTPSKQALLNEEKENNYSAVDNRSSFGSEIILGQD